jgi:hypothetical protein
MREILEFAGEAWEPVVDQHFAEAPSKAEHRSGRERAPRRRPDTSSVGGWRERAAAVPVQELLAMPEALRLLNRFGYPQT